MTINLSNNNRLATIYTTSEGEFQVFIGYVEDKRIHQSGMQVIDRKTYKRLSSAKNFAEKFLA